MGNIIKQNGKIATLPKSGILIAASDIHGNLGDFQELVDIFYNTSQSLLLFLGDLVHGPRNENIRNLNGEDYRDQSLEVLEKFIDLRKRFPGRVESLFGNHEHAHIGGARIGRYYLDDAKDLEEVVGRERTEIYRALFRTLPLIATSSAQLAFTHGAPDMAGNVSVDEINSLNYEGYPGLSVSRMLEKQPLFKIIWGRYAAQRTTARFLQDISRDRSGLGVLVHGHDPVREGYEKPSANRLCLSTSHSTGKFKKTYLFIDLGKKYGGTGDLALGEELRRLYPE